MMVTMERVTPKPKKSQVQNQPQTVAILTKITILSVTVQPKIKGKSTGLILAMATIPAALTAETMPKSINLILTAKVAVTSPKTATATTTVQ